MKYSAILAATAAFAAAAASAADTASQTSNQVEISLSSTTATGLMIGAVLVGMVFFSVNMLQGIQISEVADLPKEGH